MWDSLERGRECGTARGSVRECETVLDEGESLGQFGERERMWDSLG